MLTVRRQRGVAAAVLAATAAVFALVPAGAAARTGGDKDVADGALSRDANHPFAIKHPLPFKFGEKLVYDVTFSRFPIRASVGEITFSVAEPSGSDRHVKFEVGAHSKGALVSLFNVDVNDVFTTLADRDDMFVYSTIKNVDEGETRLRAESVFDRGTHAVRYSVSNPAKPGDAPTVTTADTRPWVQDLVSSVYFVRTRKLGRADHEVSFDVTDEGKTYNIGVAPLGREEVKTDAGTFKTIKVDARIFNGRYIRREGQLFVWMTDDDRRIPVKAWLKVPSGSVTFELTSLAEGSTPIVAPARPLAGK